MHSSMYYTLMIPKNDGMTVTLYRRSWYCSPNFQQSPPARRKFLNFRTIQVPGLNRDPTFSKLKILRCHLHPAARHPRLWIPRCLDSRDPGPDYNWTEIPKIDPSGTALISVTVTRVL